MRTLYYVPIVHNWADMALRKEDVERYAWRAYWQSVEALWGLIEARVEALCLPCEHLAIYQDGYFPSQDNDVVLCEGSRNISLLLRLIGRGARLKKTESEILLRLPFIFGERKIKLRDRYIARRINKTLREEEIGLLFLGRAHAAFLRRLAADIRVVRVLDEADFAAYYAERDKLLSRKPQAASTSAQ